MSVNEFVAWALSHAKRASVPNGAVLCVDPQNVGRDGDGSTYTARRGAG